MRNRLHRTTRRFALALLMAAAPLAVAAAEIKVLTTGAFKPVVSAMVAEFESRTGHKVEVVNDTAGALARWDAATSRYEVLGVPFGLVTSLWPQRVALATVTAATYPPEACPLCRAGSPAVKPGSRA